MTAANITFAHLLSSELELTSALHQLLEQELAALQEQAIEPLSILQHKKSELLQQLQNQSRKRIDWICLFSTSDAAHGRPSVDIRGGAEWKKKKQK